MNTFPYSPVVDSEAGLRAIYKQPSRNVVAKNIGRVDGHFRHFISLSPFLCMGTMGADGQGDVTPRGGEPGFVHVLEEKLLAMPDRPGNNRIDALSNLIERPGVGLVFFVPGFEDTLRVNGIARITTDETLMARFVTGGKRPLSVIVIEVREIYLHCGKSVKRAGLWNPEARVPRSSFPSAGQVFRDQLALEMETKAIDEVLAKDARDNLY